MKLFIRWGKLAYAAALGAYLIYCAWTPTSWHLIDGANLLIHEAGHLVFSPFGVFPSALGGTILQLAIPLMFALYFWWKLQFVDASLMLVWLGENLNNVSIYIGDAQKQALPLLGGDASNHDWNYILSHVGRLNEAAAISNAASMIAVGLLVFGAASAIYFAIFNRDAPGAILDA
jgi:hypothetical protein